MLKLQYFGHLMQRADSLGKTLMLGGIGGRRRRGTQRMNGCMASPTRWTSVWVNSGSWWWTGKPGVLRFMRLQRVGQDWENELNWTELKGCREVIFIRWRKILFVYFWRLFWLLCGTHVARCDFKNLLKLVYVNFWTEDFEISDYNWY